MPEVWETSNGQSDMIWTSLRGELSISSAAILEAYEDDSYSEDYPVNNHISSTEQINRWRVED